MTGEGGAIRWSVARLIRESSDTLRPWLPPITRREFWAVQALVVLIAGGHALLEMVRPTVEPPALYLLPSSLYFIPVVYAALNFGLRGSLATALWSALLTVPNTLLWHSGLERAGEIWQMGIVLAVAVFVGQRVDREIRAREDAEERERARRRSEARYRGLFENAAEAVLLLAPDGTILEANAAAGRLLGKLRENLAGTSLGAVVGHGLAEELRDPDARRVVALPGRSDARSVWVEPIQCEPLVDAAGATETQLMLHDVTQRHERQRDLEAYARGILAAREEEQRRIGRELHDGPLQSLVLLWRKLDAIGSPDVATSFADEARDVAEATADELRRISRALRPSVLDDLGLPAALKSEASALARRSDLSVRFEQSGDPPALSTEAELTLLRVAQEALHNVERHAQAQHVVVRLISDRARARVVVRDDGHGLDPVPSASELLEAGKLGLVGMQERARLAGGDVTVRSRAGYGTTVEVSVPVASGPSGPTETPVG